MHVGDDTGAAMLTKIFLAFSMGLLGAGGIATHSALDIQQSAYSVPALETVADAPRAAMEQRKIVQIANRP